MKLTLSLTVACLCTAGCSFYARGPNDYRTAVRKVLETKQPDVETCYKQSYEKDSAVQGKVVARFEVEPKTGKLAKQAIVSEGTTANETLQKCVLKSLEGLVLNPPDERTGAATFTWDFSR
jgi:hypothetical protein